MAIFFNRQEEVIDLELTPWGKRMFAEGRLQPKYYAFYDDDILYDQDYQPSGSIQKTLNTGEISTRVRGGYTLEKQNDVVARIKETPRLNIYSADGWARVFTTYEGSGERGNGVLMNTTTPSPKYATIASSKFLRTLGKTNPNQEYAPAWQIKAMSGSAPLIISGTEEYPYKSGASGSSIVVPFFSSSLNLAYERETVRLYIDQESQRVVGGSGEGISRQNITTYGLIRNDKLLLDVQEINTVFNGNGNFDIEVFSVKRATQQNAASRLTQLFFTKPNSLGTNGESLEDIPESEYILPELEDDSIVSELAGGDMVISRAFPRFENDSVERYLSIRVDDEIADLEGLGEPGDTLYRITTTSDPVDPCEDV